MGDPWRSAAVRAAEASRRHVSEQYRRRRPRRGASSASSITASQRHSDADFHLRTGVGVGDVVEQFTQPLLEHRRLEVDVWIAAVAIHSRLSPSLRARRRARRVERVVLGDHEFEPARLIGAVLASVIGEAVEQHRGCPPAALVLTHPVRWQASRLGVLQSALLHAASELGLQLPAPEFVEEPVAAAHWFARQGQPLQQDQLFAVYDLGGGTFDAAVLRRSGDGFTVVSQGGIDPLGGIDFDHALFTYLGDKHIAAPDPGLWQALVALPEMECR